MSDYPTNQELRLRSVPMDRFRLIDLIESVIVARLPQ
jgi:hypothetical protein